VVPEVRVAMSTCRVLASTTALSEDAIEYAAAQLERAATGVVSVDAATARLLGGHFRIDDRGGGDQRLHAMRDVTDSWEPSAPPTLTAARARATPPRTPT